jgi:hypothetical protein
MNYRRGFWRLGMVLTLGEIAFFGGLVMWGTLIWPMFATDVFINNWSRFWDSLLIFGVLPVAGYWLLFWILGWVIAGFKKSAEAPK